MFYRPDSVFQFLWKAEVGIEIWAQDPQAINNFAVQPAIRNLPGKGVRAFPERLHQVIRLSCVKRMPGQTDVVAELFRRIVD